jgi:AbrB family looped-hinge helix DNA binding protein
MELAKVTLRGQITIPLAIRKRLGVKDGDKVIFLEENGRVVIENSIKVALKDVQNAFRGEAERLGLKDEQDVVAMVREVRREKQVKPNAGHA